LCHCEGHEEVKDLVEEGVTDVRRDLCRPGPVVHFTHDCDTTVRAADGDELAWQGTHDLYSTQMAMTVPSTQVAKAAMNASLTSMDMYRFPGTVIDEEHRLEAFTPLIVVLLIVLGHAFLSDSRNDLSMAAFTLIQVCQPQLVRSLLAVTEALFKCNTVLPDREESFAWDTYHCRHYFPPW